MSPELILFAVLAIIFVSSLTRAIFGFADALVAMPLLFFFIPLNEARPLVAFMAITVAFAMLVRTWRDIRFGTAWRLIVPAFVGIPIGFYVSDMVPETIVKLLLGLLVFVFSIYSLWRPQLRTLTNDRWAWVFGFSAGVIGAAYNTPGPLIVIYGTLRGWKPDDFRATMQGYLLPTALVIVAGHGLQGLWTPTVLWYYVYAIPVMVVAVILGRLLGRFMHGRGFHRLIYFLLLAVGVSLIWHSLREMISKPDDAAKQAVGACVAPRQGLS